MPAIRLFGRKLAFGSDDFVFTTLIELTIRLLWLLLISVIAFYKTENTFLCQSGFLLKTFYVGLLCTLCPLIPICLALILMSSQGGIMEVDKRRHVPAVFYIKFLLMFVEVGWIVFGFIWAFFNYTDCNSTVVIAVRVVTISGLVVIFINLLVKLILFNSCHSHAPYRADQLNLVEYDMRHYRDTWERRCRLLCCRCFNRGSDREAFFQISATVAELFKDMDLVPSDIAAGLILLNEEDRQQGVHLTGTIHREVLEKSTLVWSKDDQDNLMDDGPDWLSPGILSHHFSFAMAIYGWPLYMWSTPWWKCCGVCHLIKACCKCSCMCNEPEPMFPYEETDPCKCKVASILKLTGVSAENILYVTFHNSLYASPYMVVADVETKSIVISIRGTLSTQDAVTDMVVKAEVMDPSRPKFLAHQGMLFSARRIVSELEAKNILSGAFEKYPDYNLVVCGHSLGAGIATLLAIILRKKFPTLRCYAYSPPLGLVSEELSNHCNSFVCSIFLGYDLIPRLSMATLESLKVRLLDVLLSTREPKYRVIGRCACNTCCFQARQPYKRTSVLQKAQGEPLLGRCDWSNNSDYNSPNSVDLETGQSSDLTEMPSSSNALRTLSAVAASSVDNSHRSHGLYFAGKVIHVVELDEKVTYLKNGKPRECTNVIGVWSDKSRYINIVVHPSMVTDHLPNKVDSALKRLHALSKVPPAPPLQRPFGQTNSANDTLIEGYSNLTPESVSMQRGDLVDAEQPSVNSRSKRNTSTVTNNNSSTPILYSQFRKVTKNTSVPYSVNV